MGPCDCWWAPPIPQVHLTLVLIPLSRGRESRCCKRSSIKYRHAPFLHGAPLGIAPAPQIENRRQGVMGNKDLNLPPAPDEQNLSRQNWVVSISRPTHDPHKPVMGRDGSSPRRNKQNPNPSLYIRESETGEFVHRWGSCLLLGALSSLGKP